MPIIDHFDRASRPRAREASPRVVRGPRQRDIVGRVADLAMPGGAASSNGNSWLIGPALAHELGQPLTAIAAYAAACARFLRAGDSDSVQNAVRAVEAILAEAERGAQMLRRTRSCLLDRRTSTEPLDLGGLIEAVVRKADADAGATAVTFVRDGLELATAVRADAVLIEQVLLNLLHNAVDAIRAGKDGGRVCIAGHVRSDGFVEISVSDDGVGVSAAMAERIFEPAVTTKREGTGLGLTISRSIVEAHGGRLWVEPNARCGTTFKFTLPAAAAA